MNMEIIEIDNTQYYESNKLKDISPIYFSKCRNVREIIKKNNISNDNYVFARHNADDKVWNISDGKNKRLDKILFNVEWCKQNIPELANNEEVKHDIEEAPPVIHISEDERANDETGFMNRIEMRGERVHNKCYFKVKDVMALFEMPKLYDTLTDKRYDTYSLKIHYTYFNIPDNSGIKANKKTKKKITYKKELFLTYVGLLRVLFVSRSGKAEQFVNWATETLFTTHLGTTEQKDKLIGKMKGVSYEAIQELFNTSARSMPCVYLTSLGYVKDLKQKMKINDDHDDKNIVYKFGLTKDFNQRKNGHKNEYKELGNIDMKLVYFSFIDPLYISQAETELKNVLSDHSIEYKDHKELITLSAKELKKTKEIYEKLALKYSGHTESFFIEKTEFEIKIREYESKISQIEKDNKHMMEILEHKHKMELKEKEYNYKLELKEKESLIKEKDSTIRENELKCKLKDMELLLLQSNSNKKK